MTMRTEVVAGLITILTGSGCLPPPGPGGDIVSETLAIRQGTRTDAHPAIGRLRRVVAPSIICTATLIHPRYILTAAHCLGFVEGFPERSRFVFQPAGGGTTEVGLERIRIFGDHGDGVEQFQTELLPPISPQTTPDRRGYDDLAVARLQREVGSDEAWPFPIAVEMPADGDTVTAFGFGCTDLNGGGSTEKRYRSFTYRRDPNRLGGEQDAGVLCPGDSGGPAVLGTGEGVDALWGVNSKTSGLFDSFSNAVWYRDAIAEAMREMDGTAWNEGMFRGGRLLESVPLQPGEGADHCRALCLGREACQAYDLPRWDGGERTCSLLDVPGPWFWSADTRSGLGNGGAELQVDRRGKEFETEAVDGVEDCRRLCATRVTCRGFTLAPAAADRPRPLCHLIPYSPYKLTQKASAYVSAVKRGLEWNMNRPGMDLGDGWQQNPNSPGRGTPEGCQAMCAGREDCAAFTFVEASRRPGVFRPARCWLKFGVPEAQYAPQQGLVSGVKGLEL
jgi:hypothetical protein